jgi:hypothetical protein
MDPELGFTALESASESEWGHAGVGDPLNYSFLPTGSLRLLRGRDKTVSVGKHLTETVLLMKLDELILRPPHTSGQLELSDERVAGNGQK